MLNTFEFRNARKFCHCEAVGRGNLLAIHHQWGCYVYEYAEWIHLHKYASMRACGLNIIHSINSRKKFSTLLPNILTYEHIECSFLGPELSAKELKQEDGYSNQPLPLSLTLTQRKPPGSLPIYANTSIQHGNAAVVIQAVREIRRGSGVYRA